MFLASEPCGLLGPAGKGGRQPNTYNPSAGHGSQEGTDSEESVANRFSSTPVDNHFAQKPNNRDLHGHTDRNALLLQIDDQQPGNSSTRIRIDKMSEVTALELSGGKQGFLKKAKPLPCSWF